MAMFSFAMTSMARGTHGLRRRQTHRSSLLHIDDSSASSGPSTASSSLTSGVNEGTNKNNQHLTHTLTKYATPGFTRYAIPVRSYIPHRRRRRSALIKPAARNAATEKLLKCRRMFSALHISCTPTGASTTKRDTKLRRQRLKKQRRIEQRRLIRSLYGQRQQSKSLATTATTTEIRPVESHSATNQSQVTIPQLHVTASAPIGIPRINTRSEAEHRHTPASIANSSVPTPLPDSFLKTNTGQLSGLSASPLDVLLMAAAIQDAQSSDDLDVSTTDAPASIESSSDVEIEADDGLLGMEMEMDTDTPEMKAAASSLSSLMQQSEQNNLQSISMTKPRVTTFSSPVIVGSMPNSHLSHSTWDTTTRRESHTFNNAGISPITSHRSTFKTASNLSSSAPSDSSLLTSEGSANDARRPFVCRYTDCNKGFAQLAHLRIHERAHTGDRPYVCSFDGCGRAFSQHGNLKTHERRHTGEKPFKCMFPNCRKAFSQQGNLRTHERIHLRVRPYQCPHSGCDRSFNQRGNLKTHQLKMHGWYMDPIIIESTDTSLSDLPDSPTSPTSSVASTLPPESPAATVFNNYSMNLMVDTANTSTNHQQPTGLSLTKASTTTAVTTTFMSTPELSKNSSNHNNNNNNDNDTNNNKTAQLRMRALSVTNEEVQLLARMKIVAERRLSIS